MKTVFSEVPGILFVVEFHNFLIVIFKYVEHHKYNYIYRNCIRLVEETEFLFFVILGLTHRSSK